MQKKSKTIRRVLFMASAILLLGCEKDLYEDQLQQKHREYEFLKGEDARNAANLLFTEMETHARYSNRGGDPDNLGRVRYDMVMLTTDSIGNKTYSFRDEHPDATDKKFYNMVLQEKNSGEKMVKLFEYDMTPEFAEKYNNGEKEIKDFQGTYSYRLVAYVAAPVDYNNGDFEGGNNGSSSSGTNDGNTGTPTGNPHNAPGSNLGSNNNSSGVGSIGTPSGNPCPSGGDSIGDSGPGGLGDGGGGGTTMYQTLEYCTTTTITVNCNGDGSHTGQSSCTGTNHGYIIRITICSGGSNRSANEASPCSSSSGGVGVLPPDLQRNPCEELTKKSEELVFKNKLAALNSPIAFTSNEERGFMETRDPGTGLVNYFNPPVNPNTHTINMPPALGYAHTHTDTFRFPDNHVELTVRMFSVADLYAFVTTCQNYASNVGVPAGQTYGIMAASTGVFAIKMLTPYASIPNAEFEKADKKYRKKARELADEQNLTSSSAKKLFLNTLKDMGIDNVVGLYRATNSDLTRWSRVTLDNHGNIVETPCN